MKINILLFLLITLISCQRKTSETEIKKISNKSSVFLTLYPEMSDSDFKNEVNRLNTTGLLSNNKFQFLLDKTIYDFDVINNNISIRLNYNRKQTIETIFLNYKKSDELIKNYSNEKLNLLNIFKNKYKRSSNQFPPNYTIMAEELSKPNYEVFEDAEKYILIGWQVIGDRIPNKQESAEEIKKIFPNRKSSKKYDEYAKSSSNGGGTAVFGIEFEINYFRKSILDTIINKTWLDYKETEKRAHELNSRKHNLKIKQEENIKKL
ncbi:hypothetical protein [Flavobacterium sp. 14A]|uniref:hypothetical protein n=1 Tax=Flavobacterium sp. 14A TaxID=2735896 RepID=UPI0015701FB3|nr:hypothetical protein [Flavobacterium sp. 14A]NRT13569.1 hypothetical protein [Flavobacterium sp. 14A]